MNTYKFEVYIPKDYFDDTVIAESYDEAVKKLKKKWHWSDSCRFKMLGTESIKHTAIKYCKDNIHWLIAFSYDDFVKYYNENRGAWAGDHTNIESFKDLKYPAVFKREKFTYDSFWTNVKDKTVKTALDEAKKERQDWAEEALFNLEKMMEDVRCIEKIQEEFSA